MWGRSWPSMPGQVQPMRLLGTADIIRDQEMVTITMATSITVAHYSRQQDKTKWQKHTQYQEHVLGTFTCVFISCQIKFQATISHVTIGQRRCRDTCPHPSSTRDRGSIHTHTHSHKARLCVQHVYLPTLNTHFPDLEAQLSRFVQQFPGF